jgi:hypothetical protein
MPRTQIRCPACNRPVTLTEVQTEELRSRLRVLLDPCPGCRQRVTFTAVGDHQRRPFVPNQDAEDSFLVPSEKSRKTAEGAIPSTAPEPREPEAPPVVIPLPPTMPSPGPSGTAPPSRPPPPPGGHPTFARRGNATPAPAPFQRVGGDTPSSGQLPTVMPIVPQGPRKSLNDRWKTLPNWVQWLILGVVIIALAVVVLAL